MTLVVMSFSREGLLFSSVFFFLLFILQWVVVVVVGLKDWNGAEAV